MRTEAGDVLAPLEIEITRTLVVAGAIASRDYQDVHHDPELARWRGSPDVFMNILTTNGLVGRYVTDHFGSGAVLRKVAIRLGAPNYPGDTMVLTGTVETTDGRTVTVRIIGENGIGRHVTGTVTVTLADVDGDAEEHAQVHAQVHAQAHAHGAAPPSVEDAAGSAPARTTGDVE